MELFRPILSSSLKGNDSLKMGVLTGVLRVAKESLFSTFNNPKIYDVMSKGYGELLPVFIQYGFSTPLSA